MNNQTYAEYMLRQGDKIYETETCYWHEYRPFFYIAIPQFKIFNVPPSETRSLQLRKAWAGLMYSCEKGWNGTTDYWSINDPLYDLSFLSRSSRRQTRQGLEKCEIKELDWDQLDREGVSINRDALKRQGRKKWRPVLTNQKLWHRRMQVSKNYPDVKAWGAFVDSQLAAYNIAVRLDDDALFLSTSSLTKYLEYRSNNALIFTAFQELFRQGAKRVIYGVIPQNESLAHFEEGMGLSRLSIKHRLNLNPLLIPIVKRFEKYQRLHKA